MTKTNQDYRKMVKEMLNETDKGFTDWEIEFLDNMWKRKADYQDRQQAKIEKIWEERM